jgi:hypothetical protein
MFLFPHNVANWTPFFLLKLFISLFIYLFILFTPSLFFCHQNMWKKKKKRCNQPLVFGFFSRFGSVRFGSVRFWFYFIWFYFILLGKWAFLQMDWKTSGLVPTMKMIIYLRRLPTSDFRPHLPFQWRSRTWDSTRPDSQLDSTRLGIIFIL